MVIAKTNDAPAKDGGNTVLKVYYGKAGDTSRVVSRGSKDAGIYGEFSESGTNYRVTFAAPGIAIGDVDGDGTNEIVVAGYRLVSKNDKSYQAEYLQLLAI